MSNALGNVTQLLKAAQKGDLKAFNKLLEYLYDELHTIAQHLLKKERPNHTLDPTAVVHELYEKFRKQKIIGGHNRASFFSICAISMRQILVDYARKRSASKRGGNMKRITLSSAYKVAAPVTDDFILALDETITRLSIIDALAGKIIEHRIFAGLTAQECAETLHMTPHEIRVKWEFAKGWIKQEMEREELRN